MLTPTDGEDFWIALVEDHTKLGYAQNIVPAYSFPYITAKAVAAKLQANLEVRDNSYIFIQEKK